MKAIETYVGYRFFSGFLCFLLRESLFVFDGKAFSFYQKIPKNKLSTLKRNVEILKRNVATLKTNVVISVYRCSHIKNKCSDIYNQISLHRFLIHRDSLPYLVRIVSTCRGLFFRSSFGSFFSQLHLFSFPFRVVVNRRIFRDINIFIIFI